MVVLHYLNSILKLSFRFDVFHPAVTISFTHFTVACRDLISLTVQRVHNPKVIGSNPISAKQEKLFFSNEIDRCYY